MSTGGGHPRSTESEAESMPSSFPGGRRGGGAGGALTSDLSERSPGGPPSLPASPTHCSPLLSPRVSGLSPFMGDNDNETLANVTSATWDFDDEAFDEISDDAKDFISNLLKKDMK